MTRIAADEYRDIARSYDALLAPLLKRLWRAVSQTLTDRIPDGRQPGPTADLGCGTGRQALLLARSGLTVLGLDRSPAMLAKARENLARENMYREPGLALTFLLADVTDLPLPDASLDGAAATLTLHEMGPDTARAVLAQAARVLRPDGILAAVDFRSPDKGIPGLPGRLAGPLIHGIERLAGKRHHAAFRAFLAAGGLPALADRAGLACSLERTFFFGRVGLYTCTRRVA